MALPEKELADEVKQSGSQSLTIPSLVDELLLLLEGNAKGDTSSDAVPAEMGESSAGHNFKGEGSGSSSKKAEFTLPSWGRRKRRGESNGILEVLGPTDVVIVEDYPGRSWLFPEEIPSYTPKKRRSAECDKKNTAGYP